MSIVRSSRSKDLEKSVLDVDVAWSMEQLQHPDEANDHYDDAMYRAVKRLFY